MIESSGQCDQENSLKFIVAQRNRESGIWTVIDMSQSGPETEHECPSLSTEIAGNILTYVFVMRNTYTNPTDDQFLSFNLDINLIAPDQDDDGILTNLTVRPTILMYQAQLKFLITALMMTVNH